MTKTRVKKVIICLIGPTAIGKTAVSLKLAKRLGAEIISCDSMQIYKGVDITSSKPSKKERSQLAHHLIDVLSPGEDYNAQRFAGSCRKLIQDIHQRQRLPLIVGGCGLYLRALLDGLFTAPGQNKSLRRKFYQQADKYGVSYLYRRLKKRDLQRAQSIHPHDLRRIIRALEINLSTARPFAELKQQTHGIRDKYKLYIFGLQRPRSELYQQIEKRVDQMFARGLVAEIKRLNKHKLSKTIKSLLGYKEINGFLNDQHTHAEASRLLKRNTRHYAKRQISWFKREKGVTWIKLGSRDSAQTVAKKIVLYITQKTK